MASCLYTEDELITKLKELDALMDDGTTQSELETGQSEHKYRVSQRGFREQYEKYSSYLQNCFPATYKAIFGPSAIKFRGNQCR